MSSFRNLPCVKCMHDPKQFEELVDQPGERTLKADFKIDVNENLLGEGGFKEIFTLPNDPTKVLKVVYQSEKVKSRRQFPLFIKSAIDSGLLAEISFPEFIHKKGSGSEFLKERIPKVHAVYNIKVPYGNTIGILEDKLPGNDIYDIIHYKSKYDNDDIIAIACQGFKILSEFHALGLIHHDLKPENMKYDSSSKKLYFFDLGLSCSTNCCECENEPLCNRKFSEFCKPEKMSGTIDFMNPGFVSSVSKYIAIKKQLQPGFVSRILNPATTPPTQTRRMKCMEKLVMEKRYELDVYAMGVILLMLLDTNLPRSKYRQIPRAYSTYTFVELWEGPNMIQKDGKPEINKKQMSYMEKTVTDTFLKLQEYHKKDRKMVYLLEVINLIFFGLSFPKKFDEKTKIPNAKYIFNKLHQKGLCPSYQKTQNQRHNLSIMPRQMKKKRQSQQRMQIQQKKRQQQKKQTSPKRRHISQRQRQRQPTKQEQAFLSKMKSTFAYED